MDKKFRAFSIMELIICLIAVCAITVSFTPIISKKFKTSGLTIGDSGLSQACDKFTGCCTLCYPHKCVICEEECANCASNQFLNKFDCKCYNCSDTSHGGTAGCTSCVWNMKYNEVDCLD